MEKKLLTKNEKSYESCEICVECNGNNEECVKSEINSLLSSKSFKRGYGDAIIHAFGLDGKEVWSNVQLAMYLNLSMDDAIHFFAKAMRMLRGSPYNKTISKFDIWACKHPDSPYAKLILKVLGIANTESYLLYTEGVEEENSPKDMDDEKFQIFKKIRRARYYYIRDIKNEGLKRIAFEMEEIKKGASILSILENECICLDNALMEELKCVSSKALDNDDIKALFEKASQGSVDAIREVIEGCKLYALLVCKELFLKPNEDLGFTTKELINIAYQGLERTVNLYNEYKKPTECFLEDLTSIWIWNEFSKEIISRLASREEI